MTRKLFRKKEAAPAVIDADKLADEMADTLDAALAATALSPVRPAKMNIYLSGPMKGYPNRNYPLFNAAAKQLRSAGHTVYNPAEFEFEGDVFPIRKAFAEYAKYICEEADAIVLLPAWGASLGVSAELALAKNCGLKVVEYDTMTVDFVSAL